MMTRADYAVSDEVWHDVEPLVRATDRRERRLTRRVFGTAVGLALVYALVWWSGAVVPHLRLSGSGGSSGTGTSGPTGTATLDLRNLGWVPETVTEVTTTHPGLRLSHGATRPMTLGPGQGGTLTFDWAADCAVAAPVAQDDSQPAGADIPLTLRVDRPWGRATASMTTADVGALDDMINSLCHPETVG